VVWGVVPAAPAAVMTLFNPPFAVVAGLLLFPCKVGMYYMVIRYDYELDCMRLNDPH